MRKAIYCCAVLAFFSISACVDETYPNQDITGEVQTVTVIGPETIEFEPITGNPPTKGTSVDNGTALNFNWVVGDTLGIFPNKGNQVEFPISSSEGSSASFDGGGWALRNESSYAAYYPFSVWNYHRDNEKIMLDYSGQVQDGNGSFSHLSAYDFLASVQTTPLNGSVTFNMERQGSILYIDIVVPEPETITSLTVSCDEAIFVEKAYLDISGSSPVVTPVETVETLTLSFTNTVTTTANETVRAYMAVQPLDFSDKVVTATLVTESGSYTAPVTSRVVNKGKAAFLRFSDDFTPVNIEFADAEVKRLCVENWDTDGDGELSYKEAAAVTDLGEVFRENKVITTFNELEYFTGLTEIGDYAFNQCYKLQNVVLPNTIEVIGWDAFRSCPITHIDLPESLLVIGRAAFSYLVTVNIPKNVRLIGHDVFMGSDATPFCDCPLVEINVDADNEHYCSVDGVLFNKSMTELVCYPSKKEGVSYSVPDGVQTIVYDAFSDVELTNISLPGSLQVIEMYAFREARQLVEINLPEGLVIIGTNAFYYCRALTSITIPSTVTTMEDAICNGANLQEFIVAPSNTSFKAVDGVLMSYDGTKIVNFPTGRDGVYTLPQGVTSIGSGAFQDAGVDEIILNEGLVEIGSCAFISCDALTSITIPSSVKSIDNHAFNSCRSLTKITVNIQTPFAIGVSAFTDTNNCPIYVPNESVEAYKTTEGWSDYADRIFGIEVEGSVVGPGTENPE